MTMPTAATPSTCGSASSSPTGTSNRSPQTRRRQSSDPWARHARRDPQHVRQRVFLADGNKQQITAIEAQAEERSLKVPVLIDYIHVSGYLGKAAAALHPGDPQAAGQWADGQLLRVLHGRARAVA